MKYELIGMLGTIFVLVSFLQKNEEKIRQINIIGASLFIIYGIITKTYSTAILNTALFFIHLIKLNVISKIKKQLKVNKENKWKYKKKKNTVHWNYY